MSYGERSCQHYAIDCPQEHKSLAESMKGCTVDCQHYVSNGREPDTWPKTKIDRMFRNVIGGEK